ncbi:hypothetical protein F-S17_0206 [Faustovirus]|nr:hypothetical protein F-S17_0206 [Faustovirus]QJX72979.1 hypothetical protein F-VV57_0217 [Faustovirus]QJX73484.1 hypothetical protein F-VV63_0218 [Faustovirus]SMH63242.1 Hypothetical protein FSTVLC9_207 [Faustovirus]
MERRTRDDLFNIVEQPALEPYTDDAVDIKDEQCGCFNSDTTAVIALTILSIVAFANMFSI